METGTVHLFVFDTMADWEPAFAVAGINNPEFQREPGRYKVATVGLTREPVTTIGGIRILPALTFDEIAPASSAMLVLPGGTSWEQGENLPAIDKASEFLAAGVPVAAICAATLALARGGLLNNRKHTSNVREYLNASGYCGSALYQNAPAVTDGNLITASGMAPVDFAYQIFKLLRLYSDAALEAWYALFRSGDASKYYALVNVGVQTP
jgi:putative intracellular protease/amidase